MALARAKLFDNWEWSRSLVFIIVLCPILTLVVMITLRQAARLARENAIDELTKVQAAYSGVSDSVNGPSFDSTGKPCIGKLQSCNYGDKVRLTIEELQELKVGAYVNWLQDPSVIGILIPSCGAALFVLMQKLFSN
ncbi:MAG: hypothetical protein RL514_2251 [Verrucomicrobiota bacterium]|jgi:hypothetical protein